MATLEDKILGEKLEYYCSSSDDEEKDSGDSDSEESKSELKGSVQSEEIPSSSYDEWNGTSSNTGPKGVLKDWQRFKQLESEKRADQERERLQLIKKLSITCRSVLDDEKENLSETDPELAELLEDDFLLEYQKQRMKEMLVKANKFQFGTLINLSSADEFLEAIDKEDKSVTVIVHIYEKNIPACEAMNGSLINLAQEYTNIKFCKILGLTAGLSKHFKKRGVPALLVYKNGQVIGNFVNVSDTLGTDFYASDVENFLLENGIIVDKNNISKIIADSINDDSE
ncbi:phosducin-like protein [Cotesia glomerata]|uniref:Phosducin domain-containing protein n=1 Tax=Cotesia glomerata TaxID=32391 RepID=A0AAV7I6Y3_COTGL|nr:phosducin-like protein [Cotesia glomerata]KAH0554387.1 hypothetical protein KQX54_010244 [Cotesia glomerata]